MEEGRREDCVFCGVLSGRVPSVKIYEDDHVIGILDTKPINPGHTLIITKEHYEDLLRLPMEDIPHLFWAVQHVALGLKSSLGADGVNIGVNNGKAANQLIFHVHVHIVPRFRADAPKWGWPTRKDVGMEELRRIASRIKLSQ